MANSSSDMVESIQLKLETNFDTVLNGITARYGNFMKETSKVTKGIQDSFSKMHKQVGVNIETLPKKSQEAITGALDHVRRAMNDVVSKGIALNEKYIASTEKLASAAKKEKGKAVSSFSKVKDDAAERKRRLGGRRNAIDLRYGEIEKDILDSSAHTDETKARKLASLDKWREKRYKEVDSKLKGIDKEVDAALKELESKVDAIQGSVNHEFQNLGNDIHHELGLIARDANKTLAKNAEISSDTIIETLKKTKSKLKQFESTTGLMSPVNQVIGYNKQLKNLQDQHKAIADAKKDIMKNEAESVANVDIARKSVFNQNDPELAKNNIRYLEDAIKSNTELKKSVQQVSDAEHVLNKEVSDLQTKTRALAEDFQKNVKNNIRKLDLKQDFARNIKAYEDIAKSNASNISTNLYKKEESHRSLEDKSAKLQTYKRELLELQKIGLIDAQSEIVKIDNILDSYKRFTKEHKKEQADVLDYAKTKMKAQKDIPALVDMQKSFNTVSESYDKLKSLGRVTDDNFIEVSDRLKKVTKDHDVFVSKREKAEQNIAKLKDEISKTEEKSRKTQNKEILAEYDKYISKLKENIQKINDVIGKTNLKVFDTSSIGKELNVEADRIQKDLSKKFLVRPNFPKEDFDKIEQRYNELIKLSGKLSNKRFVSKGSLADASKEFNKVKEDVKDYRKKTEDLITTLRRLETIQKSGLGTPGLSSKIVKLKDQLAELRSAIPELNRMASQSQREIDKLTRRSSKSMRGTIMEGIRNFRWQYAALAYLGTEATQAVKQHIFSVLNEIQEFRTSAMSIAASVSMQMVGDAEENYKKAYNFSRDLMSKLEMQAAQSILTLEDLLMLTKTVTQAGFIPKTDKDIDNLNTIGVGIKALTEGMANSGVQMRQELNALILGRQRVVDQVATMFKLQGINIQRLIDEGKKQGKDMITILAEAMQGFKSMGDAMRDEYSVATNELNTVLKLIKRIGIEPVLLDTAKAIKEISASLYDTTNKVLTPLGKDVAVSLSAAFKTILLLVKEFGATIFKIFEVTGSILGVVTDFVSPLTNTNNLSENISDRLKTALSTLQNIGVATIYFHHNLRMVLNTALGVVKTLKSMGSYLTAFSSPSSISELWNGAEMFPKLDDANKVYNEAAQHFEDAMVGPQKMREEVEEFKKSIVELSYSIDKVGKKTGSSLIDNMQVPFNQVTAEYEKLLELADKYEVKAASAIDKPKVEFRQFKEERENFGKQVQENINYYEKRLKEYQEKQAGLSGKLADNNLKAIDDIQTRISGQKEILVLNNKVIAAAEKAMNNKLGSMSSKFGNQIAHAKREYESFLIELEDRPETRREKREKWYELMNAKIKELAVTNTYVKQNIGKVKAALEQGLINRERRDTEEIKDLVNQFNVELTGHKVLDPISKINNEIDNVMKKIYKSVDIMDDPTLVKHFEDMSAATRKERIELEKSNMELERRSAYLDVLASKAQYMQGSFSPIENREGEILNLAIEYEKQAEAIKGKLKEIDAMWKENGRWIEKDGVDIVMGYSENLQNQLIEMSKIMEREIKRKQNPLWNDLTEASKNWADGLSDALASLVTDFENFGDTLQNLQTTILNDTLKILIQRKITEPFMDLLGGSGGETGTGTTENVGGKLADGLRNIAKSFGFGSDSKDNSGGDGGATLENALLNGSKSPVPVFVVNNIPGFESIPNTIKDSIGETTDAVLDSSNKMGEAFKYGLSSISNALGALASGGGAAGVMGAIGGGLGIFGSLAKGIGGFFGGGKSSNPVSSLIHMGAGLTTAFGMKDGGTISEHIIGIGTKTRRLYEFGEGGIKEEVIPHKKLKQAEAKYKTASNANLGIIKNTENLNNSISSKFSTSDSNSDLGFFSSILNQNVIQHLAEKSFSGGNFSALNSINNSNIANTKGVLGNFVRSFESSGFLNKAIGNVSNIIPSNMQNGSSVINSMGSNALSSSDSIFSNMSSNILGGNSFSTPSISSEGITNASNSIASFSSAANFGNLIGGGGLNIASGMGQSIKMKNGGTISEHIVGRGMRSNRVYEFGEDGTKEEVIPHNKIKLGNGSASKSAGDVHVHLAINQNNIDTQSGVDFLTKNSKVLEATIIKAIKNNSRIRSSIRAYS